jgi:hypothetical protein
MRQRRMCNLYRKTPSHAWLRSVSSTTSLASLGRNIECQDCQRQSPLWIIGAFKGKYQLGLFPSTIEANKLRVLLQRGP